MWNDIKNQQFITQFLPPDAHLLWLEEPNRRPAIITADLDGDKTHEIAAAFRWHDHIGILIIKWFQGYWQPISYIAGYGYGITFLSAAPITGKKKNNLIIGWQLSSIYSKLDIQEWTNKDFCSIINQDLFFSEIEVGNMPTIDGFDDQFEIALWTHDTGNAYNIEIYRWNGKQMQPFPQAYLFYFRKVADYYQKQVIKMPDAAFYWYYLADAQAKSEQYNKALHSIDIAIKLNADYPSYNTLLDLKLEILAKLHKDLYLYPASQRTKEGTLWGYINKEGDFVIKPQFESAMDFQENGLAIVSKGGLSGIIDRHGRFIVAPKYSSISPFQESRAIVIGDAGFHIIDEAGKVLTPQAYDYISSFKNGRALFGSTGEQEQYLYGYLDIQGKEIIPAQYMIAGDFNEGTALVKIKESQFALINLSGERLYTYPYYNVMNLGEELLAFQPDSASKYGYMNVKGNVILEPQYSMALPFNQGRAVVNMAEDFFNQYGLIDRAGNFIIPAIYNDITLLGDNRAALGKAIDPKEPYKGSIYAIADSANGEVLTEFIYSNVQNYEKGYASVSDETKTFFIDKQGKTAMDLPIISGSGMLSFVGDLIKANVNQRTYYYNKESTLVWQQNTVLPLNDQYKILEKTYNPNKNYLVYYPEIQGIQDKSIEETVNAKLKSLSEVKSIEEQEPLDYSYSGDYSVEFIKNELLVLELSGYQYYFGAAHGMPSLTYPNINLVSGQFYELKDLFKDESDFIKVLSEIIEQQIKNDPQYSYIFPGEYKGISENQPFYVKEDALYIYFTPYEIAPYAAGFPTFRIPYHEIMSIIDTEGSFWMALHK